MNPVNPDLCGRWIGGLVCGTEEYGPSSALPSEVYEEKRGREKNGQIGDGTRDSLFLVGTCYRCTTQLYVGGIINPNLR